MTRILPSTSRREVLVWPQISVLQPVTDLGRRSLPKRHATLLSSLAIQAHREGGRERDIGNPDTGHFGNAGIGVVQQREHDQVKATAPGRLIMGCEQGLNLIPRHKAQFSAERQLPNHTTDPQLPFGFCAPMAALQLLC